MMDTGRDNIVAHENMLRDYAHERLREMNSLKVIGQAKEKGAILSFEMKGAHAHDVATVIDRYGVAVRAGTHCAMPLLSRFGVTSTCRASFALYNTREEVDKLVEALRKAENHVRLKGLREMSTDTPEPNAPAIGAQSGLPPEEIDRLTDDIVMALKSVYDPEIPSDIYELGLIYRVEIGR